MTRWTDTDLEAFADTSLDAAQREALAADLLGSPALRERLARVIAGDEAARAALLTDTVADLARRVRWDRVSAAAAACAAIAALLVVMPHRRAPITPAMTSAADATPAAQAASSDGLLLLAAAPARAAAPPAEPTAADTDLATINRLIDTGEIARALALVHGLPERAAVYTAIGERIRSGEFARELLESLPEETRVEASVAWAESPTLRHSAFESLARLGASRDEATRGAVARARERLSQNPELRPWLASYSLR